MSDRIIFLDMDGVLSTVRGWLTNTDKEIPDRWIDPVAVKLLNIICAETDAVVVVSSTWRLNEQRANFLDILQRNGFAGSIHDDWRTKDLRPQNKNRGHEVVEWLSRHPEIEDHVILDDDSDFQDGQPLVLTDSYNGLLYEHFNEAKRILLRQPKSSLL